MGIPTGTFENLHYHSKGKWDHISLKISKTCAYRQVHISMCIILRLKGHILPLKFCLPCFCMNADLIVTVILSARETYALSERKTTELFFGASWPLESSKLYSWHGKNLKIARHVLLSNVVSEILINIFQKIYNDNQFFVLSKNWGFPNRLFLFPSTFDRKHHHHVDY